MDPDGLLYQIDVFLRERRTGIEVDDWCRDLGQWLERGGFAPDWAPYNLGRSYYNCQAAQHGYPMGPDAWDHRSGQILAGPGFELPSEDGGGLHARSERLFGVWMATRNVRRFARALGWSGPGSHRDVGAVGAVAANGGAALACERRGDHEGSKIYWMIVRSILDDASERVRDVCRTLEVPNGCV